VAAESKTEEEKQLLLELAHTSTQAAVANDTADNYRIEAPPAAISGAPEAGSHVATA
jgi:hypothetical protein